MDTKVIPVEFVKTCDLNCDAVVAAFTALNDNIVCVDPGAYPPVLKADTDPVKMVFPKGWYFTKHCLRNKRRSTVGYYSEIVIKDANGEFWKSYAIEPKKQIDGADFSAPALVNVLLGMNKYMHRVDLWTVKLSNPKMTDKIYILEGWDVKNDKEGHCIHLSNGFGEAYILY